MASPPPAPRIIGGESDRIGAIGARVYRVLTGDGVEVAVMKGRGAPS